MNGGMERDARGVAPVRGIANTGFVTVLIPNMRRFIPVSLIRHVVSRERVEATVALRNDTASLLSFSTKPLSAAMQAPSHFQPLPALLLMSQGCPSQQRGPSQQGSGQQGSASSSTANLLRCTAAGLALMMGLVGQVHAREAGGGAEGSGSDGLITAAQVTLSNLWQELQDDLYRAKASSGGEGYPGSADPPVLTAAPPSGMQATLTFPRWVFGSR